MNIITCQYVVGKSSPKLMAVNQTLDSFMNYKLWQYKMKFSADSCLTSKLKGLKGLNTVWVVIAY